MKKIILVFLTILMVTGLSGCEKSRIDRIHDAVQGNWIMSYKAIIGTFEIKVSFKNDTYSLVLSDGERGSGKYEIRDGTIRLYDGDSKSYWYITYTYNDDSDSITMWWKDDKDYRLYPDW